MMKLTLLLFLIGCAVCGGQENYENQHTPHGDSSVSGLMEKVKTLESKMTQMEQELTELKSTTQGSTKVAFSVALSESGSGNTGPFNVDTPLKYQKIYSNIGNSYNRATGVFTATVKGLYFFRFSMHNSHRANSVVSLMKNQERVASVFDTYESDYHDMGSNAAVLPLEVGDTVYVQLYANRMVFDDAMTYNTFTGFLLFTN